MNIEDIYDKDSLKFWLAVNDEEIDGPLVLSNVTIYVAATRHGRAPIVGNATYVDQNSTKIGISFPAGAFLDKIGRYTLQVRIAKGSESQTVFVKTFNVKKSI